VGTYVGIRGWLECDSKQLALVRQVIDGDHDWYNGGWGFPTSQINWTSYVYGADIRVSALDWFLSQLRRLAALPASDEDNDRIRGLFLASRELDGMAQWQVRDGQLLISPAAARIRLFRQLARPPRSAT
jgi:hypothetical protein